MLAPLPGISKEQIVGASRSDKLRLLLFLTPAMLLLLVFYLLPTVWAARISFTDMALIGPKALDATFVGLKQYRRLFTDPRFYHALRLSLIYAAGTIAGQFIIGMSAALILSGRRLLGRNVFLAALVLPMVIPSITQALIWQSMLAAGDIGTLNRILALFGLKAVQWTKDWPLLSVILVNFWNNSGFAMILFLAGLENIPKELLDASEIDGASTWKQLLYIKLPLIRFVILLWLMLNTLGCLNVFDLVYALTRGGPGTATEIMGIYIYNQGFKYYELGFGSAAALVMMAISLGISLLYVRMMRVKL